MTFSDFGFAILNDMETFWFAVVSVMLAVYVVLDGFDFGEDLFCKERQPFALGQCNRRNEKL